MTDEPKAGQSPEDNVDDTPQGATPEDSAQTGTDEDLPERFRGKSPAEIAQSYLELEKKLGEQGSQMGELKNELAFLKTQSPYQNPVQQNQQPAQQPQQPMGQQQPETNWDDRFLESPYQTTMQILQQYDRQRRFGDAAREFPRTLREVESMRPDIFGDKEISQQVRDFVSRGVQNGSILPEVQSDPSSLVAIGVYLKDQKTYQNPPKAPVNPVASEDPPQVKKPEPVKKPVDFDREEQDFIRYFKEKVPGFEKFGDKEAAELLREEESR